MGICATLFITGVSIDHAKRCHGSQVGPLGKPKPTGKVSCLQRPAQACRAPPDCSSRRSYHVILSPPAGGHVRLPGKVRPTKCPVIRVQRRLAIRPLRHPGSLGFPLGSSWACLFTRREPSLSNRLLSHQTAVPLSVVRIRYEEIG